MKSVIILLEKLDPKWLVFGLWLAMTIYYIAFIRVLNTFSADGEKVYQLQQIKDQLILENRRLTAEIAKKKSLKESMIKASSLGFTKAKSIEYITEWNK